MAETHKIEDEVLNDIKARLQSTDDGGSQYVTATIIKEYSEQPNEAQFVRLRILNMPSGLEGGKLPTGIRRPTVSIEASSYFDDDKDGSALQNLVRDIRSAFYVDDLLSDLNSLSDYCTYFGMEEGDIITDDEDRYRIHAVQMTLVMQPQK